MPTPDNNYLEVRESLYPTPDLRDLVFWEWRVDEGLIPAHQLPEKYGEPHPDSDQYPGHKLVYISDLGENGNRRWVYAAEREEQWRYNKTITFPYNDRKRFPRITRTTIELRKEYEANLKLSTPAVAVSTADVEFSNAKLISEAQQKVPDRELDSLFVAVTRTYDTIPQLTEAADLAELIKFGYRVSFPFGDENYPRITWTFPIALNAYSEAGVGAACPIDASGTNGTDYTGLLLSDEQVVPGEGANVGNVTRIYDTLPGPTLDTISKRIPHGIPDSFIASATLTRENTRKATGASPTTPSGDPADSESVIESTVAPEGESHYLDRQIDTKWSIVTGNKVDQRIDPDTGGLITTTQTIVDKPGTGSAVDSDGNYTEVRSVSQTKSIEVASKTTDLAGNSLTWTEAQYVYWPPVLESLFFASIDRYANAGSGGGETYAAGVYVDWSIKEGGSFPTKVVFTRSWSLTAPTEDTLTDLIPRPINFRFIRFGMSIPATLHGAFVFTEQIGNSDPDYPPQVLSKAFDATTQTDWPETMVIYSRVRPGAGGFFKLTGVAHRPTG